MGEEPSVAAGNEARPLPPEPQAPAPPKATPKGKGILVAALLGAPFVLLGVVSAWVDAQPGTFATDAAGPNPDRVKDLHDLTSLRAAMVQSIGPEGLVLGITIGRSEATVDVATDATGTRFDTVTVRDGGVANRKPMATPPTTTPAARRLVPLSKIDLAAVTTCIAAAREHLAVLGGRVTSVTLHSEDGPPGDPARASSLHDPHWTVTLRDDRLRSGLVRCDLQGNVLERDRTQ